MGGASPGKDGLGAGPARGGEECRGGACEKAEQRGGVRPRTAEAVFG